MNERTGVDYLSPFILGEAIEGLNGVGKVIESNHSGYSVADLMYGSFQWPWKKYFIVNVDKKPGHYQKVSAVSFSFLISFF